jgi:cell division protein FtsI (penicillin-binding protein 3)
MLVLTLAALSIFAVRLIDLQVIRGEVLAAKAMDQRLRTTELLAPRGGIIDVKGIPLAVTVEARNITADQTLITDPAATAAALATELGQDAALITERLTGDRRFVYVAKDITPETWKRIEALNLVGIYSEEVDTRTYPDADLAGNVIGFVGAEGTGLAGLEYALQDQLAGTNGNLTYERGAAGPAIPNGEGSRTEPVAGATVRLTIDRDVQYVAQRILADAVAAAGAESGTVIALDPRTGAVIAMATVPTVNPNDPGASAEVDRGNRAITSAYEPGSTSKIMTMAAVIEEGVSNPDEKFTIPPTLPRAGKEFHDNEEHGTLRRTLTQVLAESSNIGTILAAEKLSDPTVLYDYLRKFGVGTATGIDLPGESAGMLPAPENWSGTTFPTLAFGQGLALTPLQTAMTFATIANGGVRVTPNVIAERILADGTVIPAPAPTSERVVSEATARTVTSMMEAVVSKRGTAPLAAIPGYSVAGKTGTAQYPDPECGCYNGIVQSFGGFVPADDPQLVISVSIVKPQRTIYGIASSVFRQVAAYALQAKQVPPTIPAAGSGPGVDSSVPDSTASAR